MATRSSHISRRRALQTAGAAALGGGAALLGGGAVAAAQSGAPAILTNAQGGRKFRAFVHGPSLAEVVELTTRPLTGNQVLIRIEAAQACYTTIDQVLAPGGPNTRPGIPGHGGFGVVEAVGPQAVSVRVGDRVVHHMHDACGRCYQCLRGHSDQCAANSVGELQQQPAIGDLNGSPVTGRIGAMSELAITSEEYVTPVFTDLPSEELAALACTAACGIGLTMTNAPVDAASDVVIFGAGPVGLSAVMGAKVKGASRIVVVEPIPYRRELALKLGATDVVDPNRFTERTPNPGPTRYTRNYYKDALVEHLRDLTKMKHNRAWAGAGRIGPDHVIEAVGGDLVKPRSVPHGPDPTGVLVLEQAWDVCSTIGTIATCGFGQPDDAVVKILALQFADLGKRHFSGTGGGNNDRRDAPRWVRLAENGQINLKALVSKTYPLSQTREAHEIIAHREIVGAIVKPQERG